MSLQSVLALTAAALSALYFIRGALQDLSAPKGGACGTCRSGGCPVARKG